MFLLCVSDTLNLLIYKITGLLILSFTSIVSLHCNLIFIPLHSINAKNCIILSDHKDKWLSNEFNYKPQIDAFRKFPQEAVM